MAEGGEGTRRKDVGKPAIQTGKKGGRETDRRNRLTRQEEVQEGPIGRFEAFGKEKGVCLRKIWDAGGEGGVLVGTKTRVQPRKDWKRG